MHESKSKTTDNWQQVRKTSEAALPKEIADYIDHCRTLEHPESHLINVLHRVQGHFGYLGQPQMDAVSQLLGVPAAKVSGVATFYHFFRLKQRGRYLINVCMGTACYVRGADKIVDRLQQELGITFGQTTSDGLFSLEASRCLGTCGLAPVMMVNEHVHAKVTPDQISSLLDKYARDARAQPQAGGR